MRITAAEGKSMRRRSLADATGGRMRRFGNWVTLNRVYPIGCGDHPIQDGERRFKASIEEFEE